MTKTEEQLKQAIQRKPVHKTRPAKEPKSAVTSHRGKPVNMYMHPDDVGRIRSLAAYLTGQGRRVSDSQVVKAALRVAHADADLLAAFDDVIALDQRYKRSKA